MQLKRLMISIKLWWSNNDKTNILILIIMRKTFIPFLFLLVQTLKTYYSY